MPTNFLGSRYAGPVIQISVLLLTMLLLDDTKTSKRMLLQGLRKTEELALPGKLGASLGCGGVAAVVRSEPDVGLAHPVWLSRGFTSTGCHKGPEEMLLTSCKGLL